MCDGASRADVFAASTKYYTTVGVLYDCSLLFFFFFGYENFHVAKIYAFSAACAIFVVYCWIPRYLASRNTVMDFFGHSFFTVLVGKAY